VGSAVPSLLIDWKRSDGIVFVVSQW